MVKTPHIVDLCDFGDKNLDIKTAITQKVIVGYSAYTSMTRCHEDNKFLIENYIYMKKINILMLCMYRIGLAFDLLPITLSYIWSPTVVYIKQYYKLINKPLPKVYSRDKKRYTRRQIRTMFLCNTPL